AAGRARLTTTDGLCLWDEAGAPLRAATSTWKDAVRDELRHGALVALATQPGALRVEARFRAPTADEIAHWSAASGLRTCSAAPAPVEFGAARGAGGLYAASGTSNEHEELRLAMIDVENPGKVPLFVSVLSVTEARSCDAVWPGEGVRDQALGPGERVSVPVNVTLPARWPAERPMRDRYLFVATRTAVDLSPLATGAKLRSGSALPGVLEAAVSAVRTRGARTVHVDGGDWGVSTLDLLVSPAPR
ncbi:MAG: hypothetical protein HZA53_04750, partial [Planctomycetes bacterium]|nr:hypothetical protein [Planctomycetota bacterium]